MAIGTWETQNKVRPGVYINYVFSEAELINYASDGVLALNYALPLNPQKLVEITSADVKSKNLDQYGVTQGSDAYKYITTLLKYCSKLVLYSPKVNDGAKAQLVVSNQFTAKAKYPGVEGNKIAIEVIGDVNKVFNNETYIAFIRKKDDIKTPYITAEIDLNGNLQQYYLAYDRKVTEKSDIEFKEKYQEYLSKVWGLG